MRIVLIDDDATILATLALLLRRMGHQVRDFVDPRQALAALSEDIDLVVSDVTMPNMDGFDVAEAVFASMENHIPKVLLISGSDHQARLDACPPSTVIGILYKPFCLAEFSRVISLLAQSRTQCPGTLNSFCRHVHREHGEKNGTVRPRNLCFTTAYATCPHYDAECGKTLRHWVAATVPASHTIPSEAGFWEHLRDE